MNKTKKHKEKQTRAKTQSILKSIEILKRTQGKTMLAEMTGKHTKFQILISTILSARAKDETTMPISKELFKQYGTPEKMSKANPEHVKKIIRKIGFYNAKTRNILETAKKVHQKGKVPASMRELLELPGVGRKVANCVMVYAHGKEAIPVDTHVHRISNRLGWVNTKTPEETESELERIIPKKEWKAINDIMVNHGKTTCTPLRPKCKKCSISKHCMKIIQKKE